MNRFVFLILFALTGRAETPIVPVNELQPLAANITRVLQALEFLGAPFGAQVSKDLQAAAAAKDSDRLQKLIDAQVTFVVTINPEARVKTQLGEFKPGLQQAGFTPVLIKVINQSSVTQELRMASPQAEIGRAHV